jgi:hypothetical protein
MASPVPVCNRAYGKVENGRGSDYHYPKHSERELSIIMERADLRGSFKWKVVKYVESNMQIALLDYLGALDVPKMELDNVASAMVQHLAVDPMFNPSSVPLISLTQTPLHHLPTFPDLLPNWSPRRHI